MPQVDVCLWNIQNYGQDSGKYNGNGTNNALRNRFITAFVVEHQIDVLMIMEMQPGMNAALADLVTKLNAAYAGAANKDWAYSYCGCAIIDDTVDVVAGPGDLIDRTGARSECYAVVWRYHRASFTMIRGIAAIAQATTVGRTSPLNISQRGRPTGEIPIGPGTYKFSAMGGFRRQQLYPYEWDGHVYQLMAAWPKLNYPLTGNRQQLRPSWAGCRRPAYVVLQLNDGHNSLCPIAVYHAPSNQVRASWGAFMNGLAREVYVVDDVDVHNRPAPAVAPVLADYGFVGGDFNYSVDAGDWPEDYSYFTDDLGREYNTGADQRTTPDPTAGDAARRTTVQIITGQNHDTPIVGANPDDYLSHKIDLGFNRKIPAITAQRINLITEVLANPNGCYNTALTQTAAYMDDLVNGLDDEDERLTVTGPQRRLYKRQFNQPAWSPIISGSWGSTFISWAVARNNYAAHNITNARRAAEYIHIFVSDHLPLVATFNF
jgi:hypothetical protein